MKKILTITLLGLILMGGFPALAQPILSKPTVDCIKHVCDNDLPWNRKLGQEVVYEVKELFFNKAGEVAICQIGPRPRQVGSFHITFCSNMGLQQGSLVKAYIDSIEYYDGMSKAPSYKEILYTIKPF